MSLSSVLLTRHNLKELLVCVARPRNLSYWEIGVLHMLCLFLALWDPDQKGLGKQELCGGIFLIMQDHTGGMDELTPWISTSKSRDKTSHLLLSKPLAWKEACAAGRVGVPDHWGVISEQIRCGEWLVQDIEMGPFPAKSPVWISAQLSNYWW